MELTASSPGHRIREDPASLLAQSRRAAEGNETSNLPFRLGPSAVGSKVQTNINRGLVLQFSAPLRLCARMLLSLDRCASGEPLNRTLGLDSRRAHPILPRECVSMHSLKLRVSRSPTRCARLLFGFFPGIRRPPSSGNVGADLVSWPLLSLDSRCGSTARSVHCSLCPLLHPTPLLIANPIDPRSSTVVPTVTSHSGRFGRNMGSPISRIAPKNNTRYGTRTS